MSELIKGSCAPCRGGVATLTDAEVEALMPQVPLWRVETKDAVKRLSREFAFADFRSAMAFAVKVGELAEQEDHHPELQVSWGRVVVETWTHKIRGLHQNDFILAAKTDRLFELSGRP